MTRARHTLLVILAVLLASIATTTPAFAGQLVFGSFHSEDNAQSHAVHLSRLFLTDIEVVTIDRQGQRMYRVLSTNMASEALQRLIIQARNANVEFWRLKDTKPPSDQQPPELVQPQSRNGLRAPANPDGINPQRTINLAGARSDGPEPVAANTRFVTVAMHAGPGDTRLVSPVRSVAHFMTGGVSARAIGPPVVNGSATSPDSPDSNDSNDSAEATTTTRPPVTAADRFAMTATPGNVSHNWEFDLGLQSRTFARSGLDAQKRWQASVSGELEYDAAWRDDRRSLRFTPFARLDSQDSRRSHFDIRELFYSEVGENWDMHIGARRVFWGVTEFNHLVDVINQTDLVENVDGEDKLGQPMVQLSVVRNWGLLDVFVLTGFRERTFPGDDGRLRAAVPIINDATYESGAQEYRVDGAVRWSHHIGPLEFGVHHFSGTSREPVFVPVFLPAGQIELLPHYPVIDQTGLDAQAIVGALAIKVEAFSRSGFGERYASVSAGIEQTLVGVMGTRHDLGVVVEYFFDERDDEAFNTFLERDVAIGARWRANDIADTTALVGVIWDTNTHEHVFSLEASRQIGDTWALVVELRIFGGAREPDRLTPLQALTDSGNKTGSLQRDDYLQVEFTRFF